MVAEGKTEKQAFGSNGETWRLYVSPETYWCGKSYTIEIASDPPFDFAADAPRFTFRGDRVWFVEELEHGR